MKEPRTIWTPEDREHLEELILEKERFLVKHHQDLSYFDMMQKQEALFRLRRELNNMLKRNGLR